MMPDNVISSQVISGRYLNPDNVGRTETEDYERGGIAVQDPSEGLDYQNWYGYWDDTDDTVYLVPESNPTPISLFTQSDVVEFSFTFDQNMRWQTVTRIANGNVDHRWYDASVGDYVIDTHPNISSMMLTLDDKRDLQIQAGVTDVIFTYIDLSGAIHWRVQRDRFQIQYTHTDTLPLSDCRITNFGMNSRYRLQWRITPRIQRT